jgi:regulator of cell morphogenesis and NO signaling
MEETLMIADSNKSLQEIAAEVPGAVSALENYGLDYCQATRTSLMAACEERGLKIEDVLARIETGSPGGAGSQVFAEWSGRPLGDLISHLVTRHHSFTWRELDRVAQLFEEATAIKSRQWCNLKRLQKLFSALRQKLAQHMSYEEQVAFPYIEALERTVQQGEPFPTASFPTIQRPVRMMLLDHDATARLLGRIQVASAGSNLQKSQMRSCRDIYSVMTSLGEDVSPHIFLENSILFPRAVHLESLAMGSLQPSKSE